MAIIDEAVREDHLRRERPDASSDEYIVARPAGAQSRDPTDPIRPVTTLGVSAIVRLPTKRRPS